MDILKELGVAFEGGEAVVSEAPEVAEVQEVQEETVQETPPVEESSEKNTEDSTGGEQEGTPVEETTDAQDVAPSVEQPPVEDPSAEIARLRALVEEANAKMLEKTLKSQPQPEASAQAAPEMLQFLPDDLDLDDVLTDKAALNQLLNAVYHKALNDSVQRMALSVPSIISAQVQQQSALKSLVDNFYNKYPHLTGFKRTVSAAATEIASANPEWSAEQVFDAAAVKATELIGLKHQTVNASASATPVAAAAPTVQPLKSPALARSPKGTRSSSSGVSKQQLEIEELLKGV